ELRADVDRLVREAAAKHLAVARDEEVRRAIREVGDDVKRCGGDCARDAAFRVLAGLAVLGALVEDADGLAVLLVLREVDGAARRALHLEGKSLEDLRAALFDQGPRFFAPLVKEDPRDGAA